MSAPEGSPSRLQARREARPPGEARQEPRPPKTGHQPVFVKIIDFGVAKTMDTDAVLASQRTDVGQLIGTLGYMSPEQCDADPAALDTRCDVYSLGVVLYELLCGRMPFEVSRSNPYASIKAVREAVPQRPSTITCGTGYPPVKGDLEAVVLKALEKDREERYGSAEALARDVRHYLNREPIEARPPTAWTRAVRWAGRHPVATTAAMCAVVAAISLAATFGALHKLRRAPDRVVVWEDKRGARLLSATGETLHTWPPGAAPGQTGVAFAVLVDRVDVYGGGQLALVGYGPYSKNGPRRGRLCAYEIGGSYEAPIWERFLSDDDLPLDQRNLGRNVGNSSPQLLLAIADMFPESPGLEIALTFSIGPWSQRSIRIYSSNGDLLYEVWQDGGVNSSYWWTSRGLLVLAGLDEHVKYRAQPSVNDEQPVGPVVFALKPRRGVLTSDYLNREPLSTNAKMEWQRYCHPISTQSHAYEIQLVDPLFSDNEARIMIVYQGMLGAFSIALDEHGNEISDSRVPGDEYNRLLKRGKLPGPKMEEFFLSDKPPF